MARDELGLNLNYNPFGPSGSSRGPTKKRKTLTLRQRLYIWERPKQYGRKCSICGYKITKLSDLELDHTKAYSKGGTKLALAHKECNRLKGSGSLRKIQKTLGLKTKKKPAKKTKKRTTKKPKQPDLFPGLKPLKLKFRI